MVKEVLKKNERKFLEDLNRVGEVMVYCYNTGDYFKIRKKDILESAKTKNIDYYITDKIFRVKRDVMVIR